MTSERARVSLCLADGLEALCVVCAHSDLRNVNVAVSRSHEAEVLLADALALCGELRNRAERSSL